MNIPNKQQGFGAVEIIILIVVLALIGFGGWYVWQAQNRQAEQLQTNNQQDPNDSDPYENWKSYCDEAHKACFKYPSDWTVEAESADVQGYAVFKNPSDTLTLTYRGEDTRDGRMVDFYPAAIENLSKEDSRHKVVGGYAIPSGTAPGYWLVGGLFLPTDMQLGVISKYGDTPRFINSNDLTATLSVRPSKALNNEAESKAWFTSADGTVAKLIVKSFYAQQ